MTIRAMSRRMIGIIIPTRKVVLSGSVVISADHLDSLNISLVVYALILNLLIVNEIYRLFVASLSFIMTINIVFANVSFHYLYLVPGFKGPLQ